MSEMDFGLSILTSFVLLKDKVDISTLSFNGPDGSRTRVRNPIPRTSTSLVSHLTFPPYGGE